MLKRFILWDYRRASWQYDVMVGVILAFIFLTPRGWFRDQPKASSIIAMLPSENGSPVVFVDSRALAGVAEARRVPEVTRLLRSRPETRHLAATRVDPIVDAEGALEGYLAFTRR
jgi:hypothetical protein